VYYDPRTSQRGLVGCVAKAAKRSKDSEVVRDEVIVARALFCFFLLCVY
jgi:hypothetical protein